MLKPLYILFRRSELQKLQYQWFHPSKAYSKSSTVAFNNEDGSVNTMDELPINNITFNENEIVKRKKKLSKSKFTTIPKIVNLEMPQTVLAVHVGPSMLSWAVLDCKYEVLDFNWHYWYNPQMKTNSYDLINLVSTLTQNLPVASMYIMEDISFPHKTSKTAKTLLTRQQLTTSIMSCILLRDSLLLKSSTPTNNMYILQPYFSAKWFDLFVGNEIISTNYIMDKLLDTTTFETNKQHIFMNCAFKSKYMQLPNSDRDQVCWSLLKAKSFLDIVGANIIKDAKNNC